MQLILAVTVIISLVSGLIAEELPFYQTPPTTGNYKAFVGQRAHEQALEITRQAISALTQQAPGQPSIDDVSWVSIDSEAWRDPAYVTELALFITQRLTYSGRLSPVEMALLTKAFAAMQVLPPAPNTVALRRTIQAYYDNSFMVDDLALLDQHLQVCQSVHLLCNKDLDPTTFELSTAAKRFARRESYLKAMNAPTSPALKFPVDNEF